MKDTSQPGVMEQVVPLSLVIVSALPIGTTRLPGRIDAFGRSSGLTAIDPRHRRGKGYSVPGALRGVLGSTSGDDGRGEAIGR
ncbi:hypothetical protein Poly30_09260 [Planctomycetes bacterium Poly30]|uniref:Uncharacterized protein n=1 Tax=Saltatorellus ferox TaxID=2528018 RepID=A0A518EMX1_9BACT|nr:hypothetical protein Poly30_09260 [Planctomycetes bacterium Poly30]